MGRRTSKIMLAVTVLVASMMVPLFSSTAAWADKGDHPSDGHCTVHTYAPLYLKGRMHYRAWVSCKHKKPAYGLDVYLGMAYFKKGADKSTKQSSVKHDCGGGGDKYYCNVTGSTPYYGPGTYSSIAEADDWFTDRLTLREDAVYG